MRFKNQGLDLIEVQDNGSGISHDNYESVALKHHTSKLSTYSDIASLQTFGFRGEALASLCALSTFTVTTCLVGDAPKGTKLAFETSGKLKSTGVVAAQPGTTVSVEGLFHNLPVRRRELERNIKREWHKVIALLNQYACIQTNLKFSVSQQPTKGKRILLFSTKGNQTTKDNIINIFGAKTMGALVPLDLKLEMQPTVSKIAAQVPEQEQDGSKEVRVRGHVSRPVHGEGRLTPDRQMFFVNGRPCGLPQFAKTFNEVYKSYNFSQSPFIFADIRLDTSMYDVNVSPDKRSILLHDQGTLLDELRTALTALFDNHEVTVPVAKLWTPTQSGSTQKFTPSKPVITASRAAVETNRQDSDSDNENDVEAEEACPAPASSASRSARLRSKINDSAASQQLISQWAARKLEIDEADDIGRSQRSTTRGTTTRQRSPSASPDNNKECDEESEVDLDAGKPRLVRAFNESLTEESPAYAAHPRRREPVVSSSPPDSTPEEVPIPASQPLRIQTVTNRSRVSTPQSLKRRANESISVTIGDVSMNSSTLFGKRSRLSDQGNRDVDMVDREGITGEEETDDSSIYEAEAPAVDDDIAAFAPGHISAPSSRRAPVEDSTQDDEDEAIAAPESDGQPEDESMEEPEPEPETEPASTQTAPDQERIKTLEQGTKQKASTLKLIHKMNVDEGKLVEQLQYNMSRTTRDASNEEDIDNVEDLEAADAESKLQLIIAKDDFAKMRIAGQFNLGFIIATRPSQSTTTNGTPGKDDELFIIDQHASDEKYNFERLQTITVVQSQRLVQPKRLQLTALEEEVVVENLEAIEANGFKIQVDMSGDWPVGARCELTALPLSRETAFTLEDLEELIAMLGDSASDSSHIPRPSKVRKMFAMRACRSSVMIGKALNLSQMYTLVKHMGELDKPWNCPHGRPTMRHLCRLEAWDDRVWKEDVHRDALSVWQDYADS